MNDMNFDIIFLGQLQPGHTLAEVKRRLIELFKVDAAKIDVLFSGVAVPLKRNLDQAGAKKYQAVLARAGIKVQVRASKASAAAANADAENVRSDRLAAQVKRRADRSATTTTSKPMSMSERLALAESPPAFVPVVNKKDPTSAAKAQVIAESGLTVADLGADVLTASERRRVTPVSVDTSAMSLREEVGDLLDASEKDKEVQSDFDLGRYELAATGEDLLHDHEKLVVDAIEVNTSGLLLIDAGADMISPDEKVEVEVLSVDIGGIEMAPVGSDMGQLKDERSPLNPDISKLSLAP
jgi:hypothetical protein